MILRELFVLLGLDVDQRSFAKGVAVGNLLSDTLKSVAKSLAHNVHAALEYGDRIQKTSQSIGIATSALQELQYAGELADLSAEEMSQSVGILSRKMLEAKKGSEEAGKAFKGIKFQENGKLLATDEVLGNIADKFASMPDGAEKTGMAMQLFGRAGKQMIPLLNKGSKDLEELREEARAFGLVLDKEAVEESEKLNDNLKRLHMIGMGLWRQFIGPLIPAISHLAKRFLEWRKENAALIGQRLERWGRALVKVVELLADTFDFLVKNATAVKVILGAGGLIAVMMQLRTVSIATALSTAKAWLLAAAPFAAIAAAIGLLFLLFDDIRVYMGGKGKSGIGAFVNLLREWTKPNQNDVWFVKALKDFLRYIAEAIEMLRELDDVFGDGKKSQQWLDRTAGKSRQQISAESRAQTIDTARKRAALGLPMTDAAKLALKSGGVTEAAFQAKYGPSGGATVNAPMNINIATQPGQSNESIAQEVTSQIQSFWDGQLEPAMSQSGR